MLIGTDCWIHIDEEDGCYVIKLRRAYDRKHPKTVESLCFRMERSFRARIGAELKAQEFFGPLGWRREGSNGIKAPLKLTRE